MNTKQRYTQVAEKVAAVCRQAGRNPESVQLLAVSKTVGIEDVKQAQAAGGTDFGENRPDELIKKARALPGVRWHFIGNIQSRRINDITRYSTLIHSLYQEKHAYKIDVEARALNKIQDVLLEINVSGEASKSGVSPAEAPALLKMCELLANVRVCGLMTMAPQGDLKVARRCFDNLVVLRDQLKACLDPSKAALFNGLSMGMSEDWPEAVCAGATMVRIGRAVFADTFDSSAAL